MDERVHEIRLYGWLSILTFYWIVLLGLVQAFLGAVRIIAWVIGVNLSN